MNAPLPSWNDTPTSQSIIDFVTKVTETDGADFVPVPERIATFDADGTLWCEKPVQIQIAWILQRLAETAENDTSLRTEQPFQAAYQNDDEWFSDTVTKHYNGDDSGVKVLLGGVTNVFGSMTVEAFAEQATRFFDTEQHPIYKVSYRELTYQPMVELLDYLVANGFSPYIVSGGGARLHALRHPRAVRHSPGARDRQRLRRELRGRRRRPHARVHRQPKGTFAVSPGGPRRRQPRSWLRRWSREGIGGREETRLAGREHVKRLEAGLLVPRGERRSGSLMTSATRAPYRAGRLADPTQHSGRPPGSLRPHRAGVRVAVSTVSRCLVRGLVHGCCE